MGLVVPGTVALAEPAPAVTTLYAYPDGAQTVDTTVPIDFDTTCRSEVTTTDGCSFEAALAAASRVIDAVVLVLDADADGDATYTTETGWQLYGGYQTPNVTIESADGVRALLDGQGVAPQVLRVGGFVNGALTLRGVTIRGAKTVSGSGGGLVLSGISGPVTISLRESRFDRRPESGRDSPSAIRQP